MDLGNRAMLGVSELSNACENVESELVVWKCKVPFGLGSIGLAKCLAIVVPTTSNGEIESSNPGEGGERAVVDIVSPHERPAVRASGSLRRQIMTGRRIDFTRSLGHRISLPSDTTATQLEGYTHQSDLLT